jgi:GT2 family glycosyltransferase
MDFRQINFVIRNNTKFCEKKEVLDNIKKIKDKYKDKKQVDILYEESHNLGFGKGHNENYLLKSCDFFLCLNDDIGMPDAKWLNQAIKILEEDKNVGIIGSEQSPQYIDKIFAFGKNKDVNCQKEPDYSEGSILLCRSDLFKKLGGFDDIFDYFYFEDVDLCLRSKQIGYKIKNIQIRHQHFRSDSTKKVPKEIKNSYLEHNRAKFLCRWGKYLSKENKNLTNKILINIKSDGVGDIIDCYYPVRELIIKHKNVIPV